MRPIWLRFICLLLIVSIAESSLKAQGYSFNCARDTALQGCSPNSCLTLITLIPDPSRQAPTYAVNSPTTLPSCLLANNDPGVPGAPTTLNLDDLYSPVFPIGFPFIFFGIPYNNLVVSSNGYLSFDVSLTGQFSHWNIINGGTGQNLPTTFYDRALIMGPYHDIDVGLNTSPSRLISYKTSGLAPYRTWAITYYKIPLFSCTTLIENTHQITIYESTGIIDVNIFDMEICPSWNQGRAMVGVQDFSRTVGVMAPGRAASDPPWGSIGMNERWRFVPIGGTPLFRRVELYDLGGNLISTGTTTPLPNGDRQASFPNVCPPPGTTTTYVIKAFYDKIDDPTTEIFGTDTVTVTRVNAMNGTATGNTTSCSGASNGTITATATSGTAPYTWSLDGGTAVAGASPYTFNLVSAGLHNVVITDANGCSITVPVTVTAGPAITTTASKTDALCNGSATGTITVAQPALGSPPFQYSLDGISWQASNVFNGLIAGNYTVYVRSSEGCPAQLNITVAEPTPLTASSVNSNGSCDGVNDGMITVNANGGTAGYQYSIDGINFQGSNTFNVAPGNYTVTVKDNLGCSTTFNTVVGLTNNLTLTPQTDPTICEGTSTQLQLTSNGTLYSWTPRIGLSDTTISNPVANPATTTQYIVTTTLGRCSANDTVIVRVNAAPIPNAGPDGFICYGQTYMLQGSGGAQYTWTPSTYLSSASVSNPVSTPVKTITYTLSLVTDAIGCKSLTTDDVTIDVTPPIKVKTFPYDTIGYPGDQFQLLATSGANIYTWSPATGLSDPNIPNPVATVGLIGDDVLYQVIASTAAGCKGEGYVKVRVYKGPDIYVPTGFTPNGDGRNDKFTPFPVGVKSYNYFKVFNRWGQLLFSTTTLNDGWDGKLGGRDQPSGVYVWMIQGITKDDKVITKKGTVTLLR